MWNEPSGLNAKMGSMQNEDAGFGAEAALSASEVRLISIRKQRPFHIGSVRSHGIIR